MFDLNKKIILASNSPRRKDIMASAGFKFEVRSKNVPEDHPEGIAPKDIPQHLAQKKAKAFLPELNGDEIVIGADTIVVLNGVIFEKPIDREDAIRMLGQLSGNAHEVYTGVCIISNEHEISFTEKTIVHFNQLTQEEIIYYVENYKPYDKAGAYACQEWIGAVAIKAFEGDYFNVVGLPINRVYAELKKF